MNQQRTIIITDDDQSLRELVRVSLEHEGYNVIQASDGSECVELVRKQRPDLVILDVIMPNMDGLEACRRIRDFSQVPVLMLTAKTQRNDVITGLDKGADDYLVKPFNMDELLARIRALLRRFPAAQRPLVAGGGSLRIDQQKREVVVYDKVIDLTPTEYQLLLVLVEHAGKVVEHERLRRAVWGQDMSKDNEHLKVYIWHLRRKIEQDPQNPQLLLTEWGVGYRLAQ
ncbi:MAG: response regulator transcription factor [Chloroflexaceae bacterium]|nr:response regulator transcription factor [Chloroflexaceae bacterium]